MKNGQPSSTLNLTRTHQLWPPMLANSKLILRKCYINTHVFFCLFLKRYNFISFSVHKPRKVLFIASPWEELQSHVYQYVYHDYVSNNPNLDANLFLFMLLNVTPFEVWSLQPNKCMMTSFFSTKTWTHNKYINALKHDLFLRCGMIVEPDWREDHNREVHREWEDMDNAL